MAKFKCYVCGQEIDFKRVAYIKGNIVVCKSCMPKYYVRHLCNLVHRRLKGEQPPACQYCKYITECNNYINMLRRQAENLDVKT